MNVVLGHITTRKIQGENITSQCDSVDVMTGNYNDGACEGNAYTQDNWEKMCCGKHCNVNGCFDVIVVCVHMHHCCAVQWQEVSSPR